MKKRELFLWMLIVFCGMSVSARPLKNSHETKISEEIPDSLPVDKKFYGPKNVDMRDGVNRVADEEDTDALDLIWHAKTADYGDIQSQFLMAQAYEFGKEVGPDAKKALIFYKRAAQQNHLESCMRLGQIYSEEKWVKADLDQSIFWYKRAARLGYIPAELKLSDIYAAKGDEGLIEAYFWLARATQKMFPDAKDLEEKSPRLKDLAAQMTEQELRQARLMVAP